MSKKDEILDAAYITFSQDGSHMTLVEVADRVGMTPSSLYTYFSCKEELIYQCIEREVNSYYKVLNGQIGLLTDFGVEKSLKVIYFTITGYYFNFEKLRFWKNITLISDEGLRKKCRLHILNHEKVLTLCLLNTLENGIKNQDIVVESLNGTMFLYMSMIHGILEGMLHYWNSGYDLNLLIGQTWDAFWFGIHRDRDLKGGG